MKSKHFNLKKQSEYKLFIKKFVIGKDYFLAFEKAVFGMISHSSFLWMNALYSLFLGIARRLCLSNLTASREEQYQVYVKVSFLLMVASLFYGGYNFILFISGKKMIYHPYLAIGIAAFTFFELGFQLIQLFQNKKEDTPITKAITYINFSSICTLLVLTQVVLTSLYAKEDVTFGNGMAAILFGGMIFILGIRMFVGRKKLRKENQKNKVN